MEEETLCGFRKQKKWIKFEKHKNNMVWCECNSCSLAEKICMVLWDHPVLHETVFWSRNVVIIVTTRV